MIANCNDAKLNQNYIQHFSQLLFAVPNQKWGQPKNRNRSRSAKALVPKASSAVGVPGELVRCQGSTQCHRSKTTIRQPQAWVRSTGIVPRSRQRTRFLLS